MKEDIVLKEAPQSSGVYLFKVNEEIIYIGSTNNLYDRMRAHRSSINKGSKNGHQQDFYQFLAKNHFTIEFKTTEFYRELEQEMIQKYNPIFNNRRAYTGIVWSGNRIEWQKEYNQKYKEEIKLYRELHKEELKQYKKEYDNQKCFFNGEILTLNTLAARFFREGVPHPVKEAKKFLQNV